MGVGERIKACRERKGMSQAELARALAIKNTSVVGNWESEYSKPDIHRVAEICRILGVSSDFLLGLKGAVNQESVDTEELVKKYMEMDERGQRTIMGLMDLECQLCKERDAAEDRIVDRELASHEYYMEAKYIRRNHPEYRAMAEKVKMLHAMKKENGKSNEGLLYFMWSCRPTVNICLADILSIFAGINVPSPELAKLMEAYYRGEYEVTIK